jgi:hypothetical protein
MLSRFTTIGFYEAAQRVYTETAFPQDWAMRHFNLGLTPESLSRVSKTLCASARSTPSPHYHVKAVQSRDRIHAKLNL